MKELRIDQDHGLLLIDGVKIGADFSFQEYEKNFLADSTATFGTGDHGTYCIRSILKYSGEQIRICFSFDKGRLKYSQIFLLSGPAADQSDFYPSEEALKEEFNYVSNLLRKTLEGAETVVDPHLHWWRFGSGAISLLRQVREPSVYLAISWV